MKRITLLSIAVLLVAATVGAQTVVSTSHDLSSGGASTFKTDATRVCVFCHTPHQASTANAQDPLWNHTLSGTAAYGVYASNTLDASPTELTTAVAGSATTSHLCLSCHDGQVAVESMYNPPNFGGPTTGGGAITGNANVGTDLSDDHPVNFTYDDSLASTDGGLNPPSTTPEVAALLDGGTVQCSSCHDPHDNTFAPFLTVDNDMSGLCLTCHTK